MCACVTRQKMKLIIEGLGIIKWKQFLHVIMLPLKMLNPFFLVNKIRKTQVCIHRLIYPAEGSGVALTQLLISHLNKEPRKDSVLICKIVPEWYFVHKIPIPHVSKWFNPQIKTLSLSI